MATYPGVTFEQNDGGANYYANYGFTYAHKQEGRFILPDRAMARRNL